MKFGKQLQVGIYEPWKPYYIQYNRLKRIIMRKKFNQDKIMLSRSNLDLANMQYSTVEQPMRSSLSGQGSRSSIEMFNYKKEEVHPINHKSHEDNSLDLSNYGSNHYFQSDVQGLIGKLNDTTLSSHNAKSHKIMPKSLSVNSLDTLFAMTDSTYLEDNDSVEFFSTISDEINKINTFYVGKIAELQIKLDDLIHKRNNVYRSHHTSSGEDTTDLIKIRDIYVELVALNNYCDLNKQGWSCFHSFEFNY